MAKLDQHEREMAGIRGLIRECIRRQRQFGEEQRDRPVEMGGLDAEFATRRRIRQVISASWGFLLIPVKGLDE